MCGEIGDGRRRGRAREKEEEGERKIAKSWTHGRTLR